MGVLRRISPQPRAVSVFGGSVGTVMGEPGYGGFASCVGAWRAGLGTVRDAVRQELVARQLAGHLPPAAGGSFRAVLDVGCGQGTQAILLARRGCLVTGVDLSEELLEAARAAALAEPEEVRGRLRFERADLLDLGTGYEGRFDVVCCHGVLMYVPSLAEGLAAVVSAALRSLAAVDAGEDFGRLVAAGQQAGQRAPYRLLCALTHALAGRSRQPGLGGGEHFVSPDELRTSRLVLRRWREADLEPCAAMNAGPEVMACFPAPLGRASSDALAGRIEAGFAEHGFGLWALEVVPGGAGRSDAGPAGPGQRAGAPRACWCCARVACCLDDAGTLVAGAGSAGQGQLDDAGRATGAGVRQS